MTEDSAIKSTAGKFILRNVQLSFPNLFVAKAPPTPGGKAKYSAAFIFPKTHPQLGEIQNLLISVATAKWGAKAMEVLKALKAADRICLRDGDAKSDTDGYAGNYFINASNDVRPLCIGGGPDGRAPVTAADGVLYAGCFVNTVIQVWAQDNQYGGKRVNASLMGVQFLRDGPRLAGGGVAAADDFEPVPQQDAAVAATSGNGAAGLF
jgi:hypothetical protein